MNNITDNSDIFVFLTNRLNLNNIKCKNCGSLIEKVLFIVKYVVRYNKNLFHIL